MKNSRSRSPFKSAVPYGVPRGALVDLAPVTEGKIGRDRVVFADFIPNHWSAWPNTYQRVDIVERGPDRAVIRATRDWGKVTLTTVYTLASNRSCRNSNDDEQRRGIALCRTCCQV